MRIEIFRIFSHDGANILSVSRRSFVLSAIATAATGTHASAQCAPVSLGIPNIVQETAVWCWAAVAQQIIYWRTGSAPSQSDLVALAYGMPAGSCYGNPQCFVTGSLTEIQALIAHFGGAFSDLASPAGPQPLYHTLAAGRPVIVAVQSSPFAGRVVVLNGIECFGPNIILHVNDPMSWSIFSQPVSFWQLLPYWRYAIVVA
jgi:hypothetical protein